MDVKLPNLGEGADSGVVVSVFVKEGDVIATNQALLEIESEKAVASVPSPIAGTVAKVHVKPGDKLSVGHRILTLAGPGAEPTPATSPAQDSSAEAPPKSTPDVSKTAAIAVEDHIDVEAPTASPPAASPSIRHLAKELGIDLARVRGSERGGRVVMSDIRAYIQRLQKLAAGSEAARPPRAEAAVAPVDYSRWGPVTIKPMSPLRQTISRRMSESWHTVPRVTQYDEADLTRVTELRERYKAAYEKKGTRLTLTSFLLHCVVLALKKHPVLNTSLDPSGESLVFKDYYHIGIAVDTEAGLIVPVIRDADKKSLVDLSRELEEVARKARERKVTADDLRGGTFTISNQGGIGGGHFSPIINLPEVAILGIGRGALKPVWRGGGVEPRHLVPMALSYDHRVVDGAEAARFMVDLVKAAQEFDEESARL